MTAVWIGGGLLGWLVLAVGAGVLIGRAIRLGATPEPVWGCEECQAEADETAAPKAIGKAS